MPVSDTELHGFSNNDAHEIDHNTKPRRCHMPKCKTWLSAYNKNHYCFLHSMAGQARDARLREQHAKKKKASRINLKQKHVQQIKVPASPRKARKAKKKEEVSTL